MPRRRPIAWWIVALALASGVAAVAMVKLANPTSAPHPPASRPAPPASPPAPASQNWPGFHAGGALAGQAPPLGPPPMRVRWTYRTDESDDDAAVGGAAIAAGKVFVADKAGKLHAIDLASGERLWVYTAKHGFETTPLAGDGKVFIGDVGGTFHAVWAGTGAKAWAVDAPYPIHSSANADAGRVIFADDGDGSEGQTDIFCLAMKDGAEAWRAHADDRINSAPAVADMVYLAGCDARLRGLSLADGAERFNLELPALAPGSPAVIDGRVVVGTGAGVLLCFDQRTHGQLWAFDQFANKPMIYSSPAAASGVVVVGARDRTVRGIDLATGNQKWSFPARGDVDSSPAVSGGRVYVGSRDKRLYVLDLQSGRELWSFNAGRAITASPAIAAGVLVIGDEGGSVYCLEPDPTPATAPNEPRP